MTKTRRCEIVRTSDSWCFAMLLWVWHYCRLANSPLPPISLPVPLHTRNIYAHLFSFYSSLLSSPPPSPDKFRAARWSARRGPSLTLCNPCGTLNTAKTSPKTWFWGFWFSLGRRSQEGFLGGGNGLVLAFFCELTICSPVLLARGPAIYLFCLPPPSSPLPCALGHKEGGLAGG
ncbi:hypothetical protein F4809DRAFT_350874 [Biscogniauxia mediterranea]|nr:hypothetical protein F4809DRAFT_350874 [Biscogniauxia mediterranea]